MNSNAAAEIGWANLALAAALLMIGLALSGWQQLGLGRSIVIGGIRAVVQLMLVAQLLLFVFATNRPLMVVAVLIVMTMVAAVTGSSRMQGPRIRLAAISSAALLLGSGLTLAYVDMFVVPITPWFNPRYLIPLYGMVLANAMNAAALAAERLGAEIENRRGEIEALLALGASVTEASRGAVRRALVAAMMPAINALSVVGVVSLPGMMTGQIIAGADPSLAVRYQLVIVFMLTAASAITATATVLLVRRRFFTSNAQLRAIG